MASMDEKPKRRWFRFRLSTVLILTAIVAWGMALRPVLDWGVNDEVNAFGGKYHAGCCVGLNEIFEDVGLPGGDELTVDNAFLYVSLLTPNLGDIWWMTIEPKAALYPTLALAAFLAWKAGWAVVERRRARARIE